SSVIQLSATSPGQAGAGGGTAGAAAAGAIGMGAKSGCRACQSGGVSEDGRGAVLHPASQRAGSSGNRRRPALSMASLCASGGLTQAVSAARTAVFQPNYSIAAGSFFTNNPGRMKTKIILGLAVLAGLGIVRAAETNAAAAKSPFKS